MRKFQRGVIVSLLYMALTILTAGYARLVGAPLLLFAGPGMPVVWAMIPFSSGIAFYYWFDDDQPDNHGFYWGLWLTSIVIAPFVVIAWSSTHRYFGHIGVAARLYSLRFLYSEICLVVAVGIFLYSLGPYFIKEMEKRTYRFLDNIKHRAHVRP